MSRRAKLWIFYLNNLEMTDQQTKVNFKFTKAMMQEYYNKGMTVNNIAEELTKIAGKTVSSGRVTKAFKYYGFNLAKKPKANGFEFEDEPEVSDVVSTPVVGELNIMENRTEAQNNEEISNNETAAFINAPGVTI